MVESVQVGRVDGERRENPAGDTLGVVGRVDDRIELLRTMQRRAHALCQSRAARTCGFESPCHEGLCGPRSHTFAPVSVCNSPRRQFLQPAPFFFAPAAGKGLGLCTAQKSPMELHAIGSSDHRPTRKKWTRRKNAKSRTNVEHCGHLKRAHRPHRMAVSASHVTEMCTKGAAEQPDATCSWPLASPRACSIFSRWSSSCVFSSMNLADQVPHIVIDPAHISRSAESEVPASVRHQLT